MSFSRDIENNPKSADKAHLPSNLNTEIHAHGAGGWKNSEQLTLPPMNAFGGLIRSKPQSGFNQASLISSQGQLDYHLSSAGYCEKIALELELSCANAVTVIPHYLIDRIEILATEGNIMSTIYGDNIYLNKIHKNLEFFNRIKGVENLDSNYDGTALVPGTNYRWHLHLPTFIDGTQFKLSAVKERLLVRIWFSNLGVVAGNASDITVGQCDIIQHTQQLSSSLEASEQMRKSNCNLKFRFLNPVRVASQTIAMTASSQFDVRLTSANGLSAYLYFVVRSAPLTASAINTFVQIDAFELLDKDNVIVGLKQTNETQKHVSLKFEGDIFNHKYIYALPFAISVEGSNNGAQTGFYAFTSNEILRVYTNSTFVPGNYRIDCYSFDYNTLNLNKGALSVSK